jgi:hypothetical protein
MVIAFELYEFFFDFIWFHVLSPFVKKSPFIERADYMLSA